MEPLKSLVESKSKSSIFKTVEAARIVDYSKIVFNNQFPSCSHLITPVSIRDGVLSVASDSSTINAEILMRERDIIDNINTHFGSNTVSSIRFLAEKPSLS